MKKFSKPYKIILFSIVIFTFITAAFYFIISMQVGISVKYQCLHVNADTKNDCILKLIDKVKDENQSLKERNHAVWALGQFADERSRKVLEKYYTGEPCNHEKYLCQYELKKALSYYNGATNITKIIWETLLF